MNNIYTLTVNCKDQLGIVAAISANLVQFGLNIVDSAQYGDRDTGQFFLRMTFEGEISSRLSEIETAFDSLAAKFSMQWRLVDRHKKCRTLIAVSKFGHCLNDLLYRVRIGALPIEVPAVVSNHEDMRSVVESSGIEFFHIPVDANDKAKSEAEIRRVYEAADCELLVLARYMQVLSTEMCDAFRGSAINIHHSFLPSFKGSKPYHRAHDRGVKLIGATAHYVTSDLDEGPIIEQEVARVNHADTPADLIAAGRDIESSVLARAVRWHTERRVLLNGQRTIVFR
jgi:formyltetrahydrofolate deformylase